MDTIQSFVSLLLPLILLFTLPEVLKLPKTTAAESFSLELILRDSIKSPFYHGNRTFRERVKSYSENSEFRAAYLMSIRNKNRDTKNAWMRPYVYRYEVSYLVELTIGTPPIRSLLILDTGSSLTWVQCQPCKSCFNQSYPIFDRRSSSSYSKLPCDHPICKPFDFQCVYGECVYEINYRDASFTRGVASKETFTLMSRNNQNLIRLRQVVYGCSDDNHGLQEGKSGAVAGILGMNKEPSSFMVQLGGFVLYRFSYCFPIPLPDGRYPKTFLKFGTDMGYRGGSAAQTTPFVHSEFYYLNLLDISVENKRLNYPPHTFDIRVNGTGGCIIDSGTGLTNIIKDAYWKLHMEFKYYFDNYPLERDTDCPSPYQLCYILPDDFN